MRDDDKEAVPVASVPSDLKEHKGAALVPDLYCALNELNLELNKEDKNSSRIDRIIKRIKANLDQTYDKVHYDLTALGRLLSHPLFSAPAMAKEVENLLRWFAKKYHPSPFTRPFNLPSSLSFALDHRQFHALYIILSNLELDAKGLYLDSKGDLVSISISLADLKDPFELMTYGYLARFGSFYTYNYVLSLDCFIKAIKLGFDAWSEIEWILVNTSLKSLSNFKKFKAACSSLSESKIHDESKAIYDDLINLLDDRHNAKPLYLKAEFLPFFDDKDSKQVPSAVRWRQISLYLESAAHGHPGNAFQKFSSHFYEMIEKKIETTEIETYHHFIRTLLASVTPLLLEKQASITALINICEAIRLKQPELPKFNIEIYKNIHSIFYEILIRPEINAALPAESFGLLIEIFSSLEEELRPRFFLQKLKKLINEKKAQLIKLIPEIKTPSAAFAVEPELEQIEKLLQHPAFSIFFQGPHDLEQKELPSDGKDDKEEAPAVSIPNDVKDDKEVVLIPDLYELLNSLNLELKRQDKSSSRIDKIINLIKDYFHRTHHEVHYNLSALGRLLSHPLFYERVAIGAPDMAKEAEDLLLWFCKQYHPSPFRSPSIVFSALNHKQFHALYIILSNLGLDDKDFCGENTRDLLDQSILFDRINLLTENPFELMTYGYFAKFGLFLPNFNSRDNLHPHYISSLSLFIKAARQGFNAWSEIEWILVNTPLKSLSSLEQFETAFFSIFSNVSSPRYRAGHEASMRKRCCSIYQDLIKLLDREDAGALHIRAALLSFSDDNDSKPVPPAMRWRQISLYLKSAAFGHKGDAFQKFSSHFNEMIEQKMEESEIETYNEFILTLLYSVRPLLAEKQTSITELINICEAIRLQPALSKFGEKIKDIPLVFHKILIQPEINAELSAKSFRQLIEIISSLTNLEDTTRFLQKIKKLANEKKSQLESKDPVESELAQINELLQNPPLSETPDEIPRSNLEQKAPSSEYWKAGTFGNSYSSSMSSSSAGSSSSSCSSSSLSPSNSNPNS